MSAVPLPGSAWTAWHRLGAALTASPGVHRPSEFSALLASTLSDVWGRTVLDAGSGAGLIAVAALSAGASHVVALDRDPVALQDTAANVERLLGAAARDRLSLWQADFTQLGVLDADVLAVNPPQRPAHLLDLVEPEHRHLHEGGGHDGLDGVRLVLTHARCHEVRTTAADALPLDALRRTPRRLTTASLPVHPSWTPLVHAEETKVSVWAFDRSTR
ncbi:50S ribosomal protein L11 methyltransferase [Umezawaea endophytica]|uniref:50S ribosomal protein L11 methyltransferase n=1 Tax=Umezawaea endophytica TaxID=1654476 RepID=A0A9X2VKL4_9PSEU|nr:50S ribosomal protein L11 methyltransferase [Umezawaea endophytica]MCS7478256.1 50S ribosomal protein L11 methyltransferase [Umezawaea endophytica]